MTLVDAEARRRIAEDLDRSFVVEAAAGTGKTTALIGRMIALLETGRAQLGEIVAVTFTEKAAGEMKLRLRTALERAHGRATDSVVRGRLEAALAELETARIGTIHAFCADLLRERPVEAGVDPELELVTEEEERELVRRAFDSWWETRLSDPPEGVRRILRRGGRPRDTLANACRDLAGHRDHPARWRREPFERERRIDAIVDSFRGLAALAHLARAQNDPLARSFARLDRVVRELDERERVRPRDYDGLEAELIELVRYANRREIFEQTGRGALYGEGLMRVDVLSRRATVLELVEAFVKDANADLAASLQHDLWPVVRAYEELKTKSGTLDFLDLLIRARDLIVNDATVREALRARIRCLFVDEFQDTDPLQAEILLTLASDGPIGAFAPPSAGKLFVVGDPKQSIYRFRRAEVALYERIKRRLMEHGIELLTLSTSFRAPPDIQRVVNASFAPLMQGGDDGTQASYVALSEHRPAAVGRPSVIALPVPEPYGRWGKIFKKHVASSTADAVAAFVHWVLSASGWTIDNPLTGEPRALESRDVCLLFRSTTSYGQNVVTPYVLALEARGLAHVMVGGRTFHDREEVLALRTVLRAIEHPSDTLAVYATLRGPFFGLCDEDLLAYREDVGPLHPLAVRPEALWERVPVAEALQVLRELHLGRNRTPIADTLARFLDATRAHAGLASWPNGEQALANVLRVLELARRFESRGAGSFRAFVERLDDQLERGEGVDAPVVEERAAGVRVMTVHKAKGLEFPLVVLCDPTLSRTAEEPSRYLDADAKLWAAPLARCTPRELEVHREEVLRADEAEEIRLAYVAATRARDLLVVPCVGDGPEAGWVDPLHRALYPSERRSSAPSPGCPEFGDDSVLTRPEEAMVSTARSVKPGLHEIGSARVTWWDPACLELRVFPKGGLRGTVMFEDVDDGGARVEAHHAWVKARNLTLENGARPSFRVSPVTALAHAAERASTQPRIEQTASVRQDRASSPKRFGTLVHAALAECALDADREAVAAMVRHQARILDAPEREIEHATEAVTQALAHPIFVEARASTDCRREVAITVPLDDGTSAEGVIDLAYRKPDGGWVVVDFKTDRDMGGKLVHAVQLELYARAVAAASREPVETVLLYV